MLKGWFLGMIRVASSCKEAVSLWVFAKMEGQVTGSLIRVFKKTAYAALTCTFAVGGAVVGVIVGAIKGQTTETGFLHGGGIGAVAGAVTAVQLVESVANGESLSKFALLGSLMNGKVFMEWVSPAVLKAYQWQMMALENTYREISDIYEDNGVRGLPKASIQKLPLSKFLSDNHETMELSLEFYCSICLQDLKDGDLARTLPNCGHQFHLDCIDEWLLRQGSCPMCRKDVCNNTDMS